MYLSTAFRIRDMAAEQVAFNRATGLVHPIFEDGVPHGFGVFHKSYFGVSPELDLLEEVTRILFREWQRSRGVTAERALFSRVGARFWSWSEYQYRNIPVPATEASDYIGYPDGTGYRAPRLDWE